jgi:hypothetical protein
MTSISAGSLLDDGLWHDVSISRVLNHLSFTIDRVELKAVIKGDFQMLDLDRVVSLLTEHTFTDIYTDIGSITL